MTAPAYLGSCACLGPMYGDPYCYCEMLRRGLTPSDMPEDERRKLDEALAKLSKPKDTR